MASMESPFFTLSTKPDHRHLKFIHGNKTVSVIPSGMGLPSIFDKDILLYCGSQIMEKINKGEIPPKTLRISIHDFLVATNRPKGGIAYERFKAALDRLTGCLVKTSIRTGRTEQTKGFGLVESYEYLENNHIERRLVGVEITLSDWFYNSLIAKEVLTINRDYFRLRKPVERRVYEIARKHCGSKAEWKISLFRLHAKSGALSDIKHFRAAVKKMAEHDHLPDYRLSYSREEDAATFYSRQPVAEESDDVQLGLFELSSPSLPVNIPADLIEDARLFVGTKFDYYDLWRQYREWKGSSNAQDWRGGFIGFCRKKVTAAR